MNRRVGGMERSAWWVIGTRTEVERQELSGGDQPYLVDKPGPPRILARNRATGKTHVMGSVSATGWATDAERARRPAANVAVVWPAQETTLHLGTRKPGSHAGRVPRRLARVQTPCRGAWRPHVDRRGGRSTDDTRAC